MKTNHPTRKSASSSAPRVLLVDDDPLFSEVLSALGRGKGIQLTICRSLNELAILSVSVNFDVAIVDQYLDGLYEALTGTEIARLFRQTPVVLVSQSSEAKIRSLNQSDWPNAIKAFVKKTDGPDAILAVALSEGKSYKLRQLAQL